MCCRFGRLIGARPVELAGSAVLFAASGIGLILNRFIPADRKEIRCARPYIEVPVFLALDPGSGPGPSPGSAREPYADCGKR
jgi:hypothetical protein